MIQNITLEIRQRGRTNMLSEEIGFQTVYEKQDSLIEAYSSEVASIVSLIQELEDLQQYVSRSENHELIEEISQLRSHLGMVLEDRELRKKKPFTKQDAADLISEFSVEIDSLLKIYDQLTRFERVALQKADQGSH